jgi:hypothetical protein
MLLAVVALHVGLSKVARVVQEKASQSLASQGKPYNRHQAQATKNGWIRIECTPKITLLVPTLIQKNLPRWL